MSPCSVLRLAQELRPAIGAHAALIGTGCDQSVYLQAQAASDAAVRQVKYLICHLADRHAAVLLARACGMPGYIHLRGRF